MNFKLCEYLNNREDRENIVKYLLECFRRWNGIKNQFVTYRSKHGFLDLYVLSDGFVLVSSIVENKG